MQSIIVPTDFSKNAALALQYAAHIAAETGSHIHIVHIYEMPLLERYLNEEVVRTLTGVNTDAMFLNHISSAIPSEEDRKKLNITTAIQEGNVSTEIKKYAENNDGLLIIMGSQGSGSDQWDKLILGGTAQKIIRKMHIPVMIVPPDARYKPIRKIAYATEFGAGDREILEELIGFSKYFKATVRAVHIKEDRWDNKESNIEHLRSIFEAQIESGKLAFDEVEHNNITEGLDIYIDDNNISLLALLKRYHNLWDRLVDRSFALKIALHAHVPTLIFKEV